MQNNTVIYPCMMNMFYFKIVMRCWLCKLAFLVVLSLVTPQFFQLSVVLVIFIWAISKVWYALSHASSLLVLEDWIWILFSSEDLSLVAWYALTLLCVSSSSYFPSFLRLAEYVLCRDILLSSSYSTRLFCQHNIHLLIYTYITHAHSHLPLILVCLLCTMYMSLSK